MSSVNHGPMVWFAMRASLHIYPGTGSEMNQSPGPEVASNACGSGGMGKAPRGPHPVADSQVDSCISCTRRSLVFRVVSGRGPQGGWQSRSEGGGFGQWGGWVRVSRIWLGAPKKVSGQSEGLGVEVSLSLSKNTCSCGLLLLSFSSSS